MSVVLLGSTSGSCTLQEQAVAGTTGLTLPTTSGTILTTASSGQSIPKAALPTGSVLQVISTTKTDTFSTSSTSLTDITGLSITLTPSSASSKFLIFARVSGMNWTHGHTYFRLMRDSTAIHIGDAFSSAPRISSSGDTPVQWSVIDHVMIHRDSPSTTSSTTYKIQGAAEYGNLYVNRSDRDNGTASDGRTTSSLTILELAV